MLEQINQLIEEQVNPVLNLHKGNAKAVDYKEGTVFLEMFGGCSGCPSARITLYNGILPILQKNLPEVKDVILV